MPDDDARPDGAEEAGSEAGKERAPDDTGADPTPDAVNPPEGEGNWSRDELFTVSLLAGIGVGLLLGAAAIGNGAAGVGGVLALAVVVMLRATNKSRVGEPFHGRARVLGFVIGFVPVVAMFGPAVADKWGEVRPSSAGSGASSAPVDPFTAAGLRTALDGLSAAGFGTRFHELVVDGRTVRMSVASPRGNREVSFRDGRVTDTPDPMTALGSVHDLDAVPVDRLVALVDRAATQLGVPGPAPLFKVVRIWNGIVIVTVGDTRGNAVITADMTGAIRNERPYAPGLTSSCTTIGIATESAAATPTVFGTQCPSAPPGTPTPTTAASATATATATGPVSGGTAGSG